MEPNFLDEPHIEMSAEAPKVRTSYGGVRVVVIIPYYNGAKFIRRALDSVFSQTVRPDEVVVVNDGSRDDERDFLHSLASAYPMRIIDKPNGGQGSARNLGVAMSAADFICFLDQDDFYLPRHIEILKRALPRDEPKLGFVYADLHVGDAEGNILFMSTVKEHSPQNPKRSLIDLLQNDMFVLPSASIISRKAYEAVGGFDEQFTGYEDDDLFMRMFRLGYSNHFVDKAVTVWCIHKESTSYSIKMARSRARYFTKLLTTFGDDPERGLYFFRDCLSPRFGRMFLLDAFKAAKNDSPARAEVSEILRIFASTVYANEHTGRRRKLKLWLAVILFTRCPPWLVRLSRQALRFHFIRRRATW